jgi:hypothetical protein
LKATRKKPECEERRRLASAVAARIDEAFSLLAKAGNSVNPTVSAALKEVMAKKDEALRAYADHIRIHGCPRPKATDPSRRRPRKESDE